MMNFNSRLVILILMVLICSLAASSAVETYASTKNKVVFIKNDALSGKEYLLFDIATSIHPKEKIGCAIYRTSFSKEGGSWFIAQFYKNRLWILMNASHGERRGLNKVDVKFGSENISRYLRTDSNLNAYYFVPGDWRKLLDGSDISIGDKSLITSKESIALQSESEKCLSRK